MKPALLISSVVAVAVVALAGCSAHTGSSGQRNEQSERIAPAVYSQWTTFAAEIPGDFRDCQFLDENRGWGITTHSLWKTEDGGRSWIEIKAAPTVALLKNYEPQETLEQVHFLSQTEGWMVEGSYLTHTTDAGASWREHRLKNVIVRSCHFVDGKKGWVVGQILRLPSKKGDVESWYPVIYRTEDGGESWRCLFTGPEDRYPLWDVWTTSTTKVWAVGVLVLHSIDSGQTWKAVRVAGLTGVSGMPVRVRFLDSNTGWMTTNEPGGYLFTNDGGRTWEARAVAAASGSVSDIVYVTANDAWAVGKGIYHSTDGGRLWSKELDGDFSRIQYLKDKGLIVALGEKRIAKRQEP